MRFSWRPVLAVYGSGKWRELLELAEPFVPTLHFPSARYD